MHAVAAVPRRETRMKLEQHQQKPVTLVDIAQHCGVSKTTVIRALTEGGRIESEMTVTRLAPDRFYVLSAAVAQMHDLSLLRNAVRPDERVTITDITEAYGTLVLAGPKSREVLSRGGNVNYIWVEASGARRVVRAQIEDITYELVAAK